MREGRGGERWGEIKDDVMRGDMREGDVREGVGGEHMPF